MLTFRFSVVILMLVLCHAVTARGKECHTDYREIGQFESRIASTKRQSFIFQNEKRKFGEEFHLQYPAFPGRLFPARFVRISSLDSSLRRRLKEIKKISRPNSKDEREVGELVVKPFVGKSESARYTSENATEISAEAQMKAVTEKDLFRNILAFTHITDIHTHPNLGKDTNIFFSSGDIKSYVSLKQQIESVVDRPVHFRAIVLPNCDDCDDVVLIMDF